MPPRAFAPAHAGAKKYGRPAQAGNGAQLPSFETGALELRHQERFLNRKRIEVVGHPASIVIDCGTWPSARELIQQSQGEFLPVVAALAVAQRDVSDFSLQVISREV
jgi:hypothetical protein